MNKTERGFAPVIILIVFGLIILAAAFFGLNKFTGFNPFKPSSSPALNVASQKNSNSAKEALYEQNKEKIKADLHLTEEQFQILKRFSAD